MSDTKPYIVIFDDNTPKQEIDSEIKKVEAAGGKIKQRYDQDFMKGFAATLPANLVEVYTNLTVSKADNKEKTYLSYIEPDSEVKTM